MEYASHSVGTAGLTTGIIGTALGVLNGGLGLLNNGGAMRMNGYNNFNGCHNFVTQQELNYVQELGRKDAEIALLKSEQNTEIKIADVYERLITRINADARAQADWNTAQAISNAQISGAIAANAKSIETLKDLTKVVIPINNVCPRPMPRYNSWTAPTE